MQILSRTSFVWYNIVILWRRLEHRYSKPESGMHIARDSSDDFPLFVRLPLSLYRHYCLPCLCVFLAAEILVLDENEMINLQPKSYIWAQILDHVSWT